MCVQVAERCSAAVSLTSAAVSHKHFLLLLQFDHVASNGQ
jgi:hypothetical protein